MIRFLIRSRFHRSSLENLKNTIQTLSTSDKKQNPSQLLKAFKMSTSAVDQKGNLKNVVLKLNELMPIAFAEDWDNVGLLVEPSVPHNVSKMLLTNDLTPEVLDEALNIKANLILSYHPPVFSPLKRLCQSDWKQKIVVKAIENRIAIYSPHTSCDSLKEGVNDWLLSAFDNACVMPLATKEDPAFCYSHSVTLLIANEERSKLIQNLKSFQNVTNIESFNVSTFEQEKIHIAFVCTKSALPKIGKLFLEYNVENPVFTEIKKPPLPDVGLGRISKLKSKISLNKAIEIVKEHLKLPHVRVATSHGPKFNSDDEIIKSIAVCAGSGSSVLRGVKADLYITGEMSHHEVLSAIHNGSSVILCEHSNTERGYLSLLRDQLLTSLHEYSVDVCISKTDSDPLRIV